MAAAPATHNIYLNRGDSLRRRMTFYYLVKETGEQVTMDLRDKNIYLSVKDHPNNPDVISIPIIASEGQLEQGKILFQLTHEQVEQLFSQNEYDSGYIWSLQMEEKSDPDISRTTLVKGAIRINQNYATKDQ
ncbi:hypothetical protein [Shewanella algae]|uniref:hypothetical protein n=1 Tax=Shewanella algae TaxID=38313 RepID=UPI0030047A92